VPGQAAPDGVRTPGSGEPPPSRNPGAIGRALAELRADPRRSNNLIARAAGTSEASVRRARAALEDAGVIPAVSVTARAPRAYPSTSGHAVVLPEAVALAGLCIPPNVRPEHRYIWVSDDPADIALARAICRSCSVQMPSRSWALQMPWSTWGIFGDTDRAQRRRLRRNPFPL
jgi:Transcription factor WhiB/Winged helix-turn-helix DNA-binding